MLEILLIFPYAISEDINGIYGLIFMLFFSTLITIGYLFELGKGALEIANKQLDNALPVTYKNSTNSINYIGSFTLTQSIRKLDSK